MVWNTVLKETSKMRKDGNLALSLNCISQSSSNKLPKDRGSSTNDDLGGDTGVGGEVEGMTILLFRQRFTESLPHVELSLRHWIYTHGQNKVPPLVELTF